MSKDLLALNKRERLALRQAVAGRSASAPTKVVRRLEELGLVIRTGHFYEPQEWGRVVRKEPLFYLSEQGEEVAREILAELQKRS